MGGFVIETIQLVTCIEVLDWIDSLNKFIQLTYWNKIYSKMLLIIIQNFDGIGLDSGLDWLSIPDKLFSLIYNLYSISFENGYKEDNEGWVSKVFAVIIVFEMNILTGIHVVLFLTELSIITFLF